MVKRGFNGRFLLPLLLLTVLVQLSTATWGEDMQQVVVEEEQGEQLSEGESVLPSYHDTQDEGGSINIITDEGDHPHKWWNTSCPLPKCVGTVVACIPLCFSPNNACCRCLIQLDPSLDCCPCYWHGDSRFQGVCTNATCGTNTTTTTTTETEEEGAAAGLVSIEDVMRKFKEEEEQVVVGRRGLRRMA